MTRNRRGASLVELMILMSACVVILTLSTLLIHRILHVQSKSRRFLDAERVSSRLSAALRRDVHRADQVALLTAADGGLLRLTLPLGQQVEYRQHGSRIRRTLHEANQLKSQEEYALPAGSELRTEMPNERLVVLATATPASFTVDESLKVNPHAESAHLHIEAALLRKIDREVRTEREEASP